MKLGFSVKLLLFFIASALFIGAAAYLLSDFRLPFLSRGDSLQTNTDTLKYKTVIIDAGHGGEDGGASSAKGLIEKNVNLEISKLLCEMLRADGINVVMTREDDRLLYDRNVDYHGRKKKLDLAARLTIADTTPDAIFISIHMNSFTNPKYSGLQVWYSPNDPDSSTLAGLIQSKNKSTLQPENTRKTKVATSSIFLLENATCPAVLVECGFLSNPAEAALFETDEYKQKVASMLFDSITEFLEKSTDV